MRACSDSVGGAGFKAVQDTLRAVQHNPSFSLMVAFPRTLGLDFGACQLAGHKGLRFLSRDSSKPVRAHRLRCFSLQLSHASDSVI